MITPTKRTAVLRYVPLDQAGKPKENGARNITYKVHSIKGETFRNVFGVDANDVVFYEEGEAGLSDDGSLDLKTPTCLTSHACWSQFDNTSRPGSRASAWSLAYMCKMG